MVGYATYRSGRKMPVAPHSKGSPDVPRRRRRSAARRETGKAATLQLAAGIARRALGIEAREARTVKRRPPGLDRLGEGRGRAQRAADTVTGVLQHLQGGALRIDCGDLHDPG